MAKPKPPRPDEAPNVGAEEVPPGATRAAFDREHMRKGDAEENGPADRHAAGEPGGGNLSTGLVEPPDDADAEDVEEDAGGPTAGTRVGTEDGTRKDLGETRHAGMRPGNTRAGESTVGTDPDKPTS